MFLPKDKQISKEVFLLALPIILSNLSRVLMSIVDIAMVGRLGKEAIAATGMGGMLTWGALSVVLGVRTAVQTITSRRVGQKRKKECGTAFHNGLIMALFYGVPVSVFGMLFSKNIVPFFIKDEIATPLTIEYTSIVFLSIIFSAISFVFVGFLTGIEKTKPHLVVTIASNFLNVYLNAGLIYGSEGVKALIDTKLPGLTLLSGLWSWLPFPALGVKGAAIATLLSTLFMCAHYSFYLFNKKMREDYRVFSFSLNIKMMKTQLRLAVPMGLQETTIAIGWSIFYKIMGIIGLVELATTELVFVIMHASFMPAIGVGQACATLVGKHMGEKNTTKAETSIYESIRISEYIMGTMGILFVLFPVFFLRIFTNDPEIIALGIIGIRVVGFLQFVDAIGMTLWFALSGAGNTFFPALVESLLIWLVMIPGSWFIGVYLKVGFVGPFTLLPSIYITFATIMVMKIRKGDWKNIEV